MNIVGFKIWYTDGSMRRGKVWEDLPSKGVQIIMCYYDEFYTKDKRYRKTIDGCDWYWFLDGDIHGERAIDGPTVPKPSRVPDALLKKGEWARSLEEFTIITNSASKDETY